jgi:hypothetical protein
MKRNALFLSSILILAFGLSGCEDNGLRQGDPNYWTSSRRQFTIEVDQPNGPQTLYFLDNGDGTATLTFDGSNPRHWASSSSATVSVTTYVDTLVIPASVTYNGATLRVTAIGNEALMGCRALVKAVLPESITTIGEGAFAICTTLKDMNIPSGVKAIPTVCFGQCQALDSVSIPATVQTIGNKAFYGCKRLQKVDMNEGLTSIGDMAFYDCNSDKLLDITIPASVQTIGADVFGGHDATTYSHILAYHMAGATPPALGGALYYRPEGLDEVPVIYVPKGAVDAYQAAANWNKLTIREEL